MDIVNFKMSCDHCPLYRDGVCTNPGSCNYRIHHPCPNNYLCADMNCQYGHGIGPKKRKYITDIYYTYCRSDEVNSDCLCRFDFMCTKGDKCQYEHTLVDKKHRYTISNILNAVDDDEAYELYDMYYLRFQKKPDLYPGSRRNMMFMKSAAQTAPKKSVVEDDASSVSAKSTKKASSCESDSSNVSYVEKVNATVKTTKCWNDKKSWSDIMDEDDNGMNESEYPSLISTTTEVVVKKEVYHKDVETSNRFTKLDVDDDVEVDSCEEEECTALVPSPKMTHMDTLTNSERLELENLRKMKNEFDGFKNDMKQLLAMKQMFEQMAKMMK